MGWTEGPASLEEPACLLWERVKSGGGLAGIVLKTRPPCGQGQPRVSSGPPGAWRGQGHCSVAQEPIWPVGRTWIGTQGTGGAKVQVPGWLCWGSTLPTALQPSTSSSRVSGLCDLGHSGPPFLEVGVALTEGGKSHKECGGTVPQREEGHRPWSPKSWRREVG